MKSKKIKIKIKKKENKNQVYYLLLLIFYFRNRLATKPVILKVCNIKLSFDIWLVLYIYTLYYISNITQERTDQV